MNWQKLKYLLPSVRRQYEQEMREELEALAALAGSRELGNLTLAAEDARAVWGWTWLSSLVADIRYAVRTLLRQPGFLMAAALTLALGVGANTTIYSVMNATILRPLPFADASRLVLVWKTFGGNENIISAPDYWDYKRQTHSFEGIAIFDSGGRGYNLSAMGSRTGAGSGFAGFGELLSAARSSSHAGAGVSGRRGYAWQRQGSDLELRAMEAPLRCGRRDCGPDHQSGRRRLSPWWA